MALSSMYESEKKWRVRFMELADHVATWSKDPSTKVGAVITAGKEILSLGYNGFAPRTPDHDSYLENREEKYPRIIHAETNAILRLHRGYRPLLPMTIYVTHMPCANCASLIIAAGITEVVTRKPPEELLRRWPHMEKSFELFHEARIKVSFAEV